MLSVRIIDEQIPVIVVEGEIKADNKNVIDEAVRTVLGPNKTQLILDLTGVKTLDAGEIQVIIEATHRTLGRGGRLALVVTEKDKEHALKGARIADIPGILIFEDRLEAMRYMGERGYGASA